MMHAYVVPQSRKVVVFNRIAPDASGQTRWRPSRCKLLRQELRVVFEKTEGRKRGPPLEGNKY